MRWPKRSSICARLARGYDGIKMRDGREVENLIIQPPELNSSMKRGLLCGTLFASILSGALFLSGCSTVSTRIDSHRAAFDSLPPDQRALVSQGKIGGGMSPEAVFIAWGQPQQK